MGNEYMFRVYSENMCGLSDEPCQGKNTAKIAKTGLRICLLLLGCAAHANSNNFKCHVDFFFSVLCFAPHLLTGLVLKENQYKEKDMSCVPKFTQPLVDRSVVAGYSTAISCAVKGFPRVSTRTYLEDSVENNSAATDVSDRKQIPDHFSISKHKGQDVSLMFER